MITTPRGRCCSVLTLYTGTSLRYRGPGSRLTQRSEPGPCCQPPTPRAVTVLHYLTPLSRPQICLLSRQQQSARPFLPTEENVNVTLCANRYPDARVWGSQTVSACSCLQTKRPELIYSLRVSLSPAPPGSPLATSRHSLWILRNATFSVTQTDILHDLPKAQT